MADAASAARREQAQGERVRKAAGYCGDMLTERWQEVV